MKRIIRLTENDLTRIVKRVIKEQDEVVTLKQLKKMGYSYPPGQLPPSNDLIDSGVSSVGKTQSASSMSLMSLVRQKNLPSTNNDGVVFYKTLDNGNIESKWMLYKK